jgi:hypothetical protein
MSLSGPRTSISGEGRAVGELHARVLTADAADGMFGNVPEAPGTAWVTPGGNSTVRAARRPAKTLLDVGTTSVALTLSAARFLCLARPGVVPRQVKGRRVAVGLETVAELRSLNLRRSWAAWGCEEAFSERFVLLSCYRK